MMPFTDVDILWHSYNSNNYKVSYGVNWCYINDLKIDLSDLTLWLSFVKFIHIIDYFSLNETEQFIKMLLSEDKNVRFYANALIMERINEIEKKIK